MLFNDCSASVFYCDHVVFSENKFDSIKNKSLIAKERAEAFLKRL